MCRAEIGEGYRGKKLGPGWKEFSETTNPFKTKLSQNAPLMVIYTVDCVYIDQVIKK